MSLNIRFRVLEQELATYKEILGKAADTVLNEQVSDYPIFIAHQQELNMGILLIERKEPNIKWSIHVSSLEEFVTKNIIQPDKVDDFKQVYKDPEEFLCFFVLSELGATFNFLPRKK